MEIILENIGENNITAFQKPDTLYNLDIAYIQFSGIGFRGKYILSAARLVAGEEINICCLKNLSTAEAREKLMLFPGVGPKVSDCIMLFSMGKDDAFPIDIWVEKGYGIFLC